MSQSIAIIGGGAAGMMAAATIIERDPTAQVVLFEKNRTLGRKVIISGGGRCNVTTGIRDLRQLARSYERGAKFLTTALHSFPPAALSAWFEDHGVPLKTEPDQRVFPQSDNGEDIVNVFLQLFRAHQVDVRLGTAVVDVAKTAAGFQIRLKNGDVAQADKLIITTGGQAYRHTGSTGDGYAFAEKLGHTITPLAASLNAFVLHESWVGQLAGVSFAWARLTAAGKQAAGPIVCTHRGISGPAVFALSAKIAFEQYSKTNPLELLLDVAPQQSDEQLRTALHSARSTHSQQRVSNALQHWVAKSVAEQVLTVAGLAPDMQLAQLSNAGLQVCIDGLKRSRVHIVGRAAGSEFVTAGGVTLAEVNPRTMESRRCLGLYFAGEILDVDGITGGFNLQASWAAGRLAGQHSVKKSPDYV